MAQAGHVHLDMPAYLPHPANISLWANLAGSMAYYYALYDIESMDFADFTVLKDFVDHGLAVISQHNNIRHIVIFNIFVGEAPEDLSAMINSSAEFALVPKYDVYYGVDTATSQILYSPKQPHGMNGSLKKIQRALTASPASSIYAVPVTKYPIFSYIIMGINLLLFILMEMDGGSNDVMTLIRYGAVSHHLVFTMGEYHRLFTPIFLHIGFMHLMVNSMSMILFGMRAERYLGHVKFLLIYLLSGIAGNLAMALSSEFAVGAGASGAIFGMIGALFAFMKLRKQYVENFNTGVLTIIIVVNVLMGFTMNNLPDMPNVGNAAHIGGLIVGLILGYLLTGRKSGIKNGK